MRLPSALHSQAGSGLVACCASLGSRKTESSDPEPFIAGRALHAGSRAGATGGVVTEFLIWVFALVHAGRAAILPEAHVTLIDAANSE
jgi:hypothetical protein